MGTRYSRHLSTPSARVAILVIELPSSGLPEYVVSTTNSHLMQFNNGRALIDTGGKNPLTRPPCLVAHTHRVRPVYLLLHIPISHADIINQCSI